MLEEFITRLKAELTARSFYVLGAQGQGLPQVTDAFIKTREHSKATEMARAKAGRDWRKTNGYLQAKAFDCSGLGIHILQQMKTISTDTTANGMYGWCPTKLTRGTVKKGDWVFRGTASRKSHIGYVINDQGDVIECKGRAVLDSKGNVKDPNGVVVSKVSDTYWQYFARPKFFKEEIEKGIVIKPANKQLTVQTPYLRGEGIKQLQLALQSLGYNPGTADGIFGKNTDAALKDFISVQLK